MEFHVAMEQLFRERPAPVIQGNSIPQSSGSSSPNLPLVLYQPPDKFFVKLREFTKLNGVKSTVQISTNYSASNTISQLGSRGFILVPPIQRNMVGSFTQYP